MPFPKPMFIGDHDPDLFTPQWTFRDGTKYRLTAHGTWFSSPAATSAPYLEPTPGEEIAGYVRITRPYALQVSRDGKAWTTSPKGGLPEALTILLGLPK